MVSKFAERLLGKIDQGEGMLTTLESHEYEGLIDAELQEVREVVKMVAQPYFEDDGKGGIRYWITSADVERARVLMAQLEVK